MSKRQSIREEERASGNPAEKEKPILKPSSTSNRNFIPMRERKLIWHWRSEIHRFFQMSKFISNSLRHKEVCREEDAGVVDYRIVEKCMEVRSEDSRYWSDEVKQKWNIVPHWSAEKWIDVLSKGDGQKDKDSIMLQTRSSRENLVLSSRWSLFRKWFFWKCLFQSCIARQCTVTPDFTKYVSHVGHGNKLRSKLRKGLVPGGSSSETGRSVICTVVDPMNDEQGSRDFLRLVRRAAIAPFENNGNHLKTLM